MISLKDKVEKNLFSRSRLKNSMFEEATFYLIKKLGISPLELMSMPIPLVLFFIERQQELDKKEAKANNKRS